MTPNKPNAPASDEGSALVEFLALALLLLIPIIYLVLTLTELHAGKFAAASAAQSAARVFAGSPDVKTAHQRAAAATRIALDDQGFSEVPVTQALTIHCDAVCLESDGYVHVTVQIPISVPGIPFLDHGPAVMTVEHSQVAANERFRSQP